jgi:hypothetical protein
MILNRRTRYTEFDAAKSCATLKPMHYNLVSHLITGHTILHTLLRPGRHNLNTFL